VQEIEEDDSGLSTLASGGPVTSKREEKTTVMIADNQTVVLGGLVGITDTEVETKLPILGDLPLVGALFRGKRTGSRKTNMIILLTPHIIDDEDDMYEVQMVKEAQRQEFLRRFYGKSRDEYMDEVRKLLRFSMNHIDEPSQWRGPTAVQSDLTVAGEDISPATIDALNEALDDSSFAEPGAAAGTLPDTDELDLGVPAEDDGPVDTTDDAVEAAPEAP